MVQSFTHTVSRSSNGGIWFNSCLVLAHLLRAHLFLLSFPPSLPLWALVFFLFSLALRSDLGTQRRDTGRGGGVLDEGRVWGSIGRGVASVHLCLLFLFGLMFYLLCVPVCTFPPFSSLRVHLDTRLPGETRDTARGKALVSKSDCRLVDKQSG